MPPMRLATTGRPFHIASATVSPNPSARLFWTTTAAPLCSALTIAAFSSASVSGSIARWMRARTSGGSSSRCERTSFSTAVALGVVGHIRGGRARVHELGRVVGSDVIGEHLNHAHRVLERVPARDLQHVLVLAAERMLLDH